MNLLKNGDFEKVVDGKPDGWQTAGAATVKQTLASDVGREGGHSAKLACTEITGTTPATHVMLAQNNTVALQNGKWYRLRFWAKQEGMEGESVQIAVNQTKPWVGGARNAGAFQPTDEWKEYEFQFRAVRDVPAEASRFQMWHHSVGTLWVDDMTLDQIPGLVQTPRDVVEAPPGKNMIPNASFECGPGGWGSIAKISTWGGNLLHPFGAIDEMTAADGKRSLKVQLGPDNFPVFYFDYFHMYREPIKSIRTVNLGWLKVEKDGNYTLSAAMKSATPGVKVKMAMENGGYQDIALTTDWQRYSMTRKALREYCFVAIELDLPGQNLEQATIWIDAVQLEKSDTASDFQPYAPIEVQLATGKPMNVFAVGEPVALETTVCNAGEAEAKVVVSVKLQDFFDEPAGETTTEIAVPPKLQVTKTIALPVEKKGFCRVTTAIEAGGAKRTHVMRIAVVESYGAKDSIFAVNHAYPWDELMKVKQLGGTMWTRDWSIKWRDVEPEKGRFDFTETDHQINRPIKLGDQVLGLLPFPSSDWSSTAPADFKADNAYLQERERVAYKPRDMGEFENYVAKTVEHYKDRIKYWEIMNEPLYTTYAVPERFGHKPEDYVEILKHAFQTIRRVDPEAKVIGGIAGLGSEHFSKAIIDLGALDYMDYINTHTYPGMTMPERTHDQLVHLNEMMDAKGKRLPMWCTEYAYYADDDMPARPMIFELPFVKAEMLCAAYFIRLSAIMMGDGHEKLVFHAGTCGRANSLSPSGFLYDFDGVFKVYPAISAMSNIFGADTKTRGKLETPEGVWAYLFENPRGAFAMVWCTAKAKGALTLKDDRLKLLDIQGNPIAERQVELTEYPMYVIGAGMKADEVRDGFEVK
ncbi:MAG: carbohydrate binding domain-containing protein [Planctomycetota bacterium]